MLCLRLMQWLAKVQHWCLRACQNLYKSEVLETSWNVWISVCWCVLMRAVTIPKGLDANIRRITIDVETPCSPDVLALSMYKYVQTVSWQTVGTDFGLMLHRLWIVLKLSLYWRCKVHQTTFTSPFHSFYMPSAMEWSEYEWMEQRRRQTMLFSATFADDAAWPYSTSMEYFWWDNSTCVILCALVCFCLHAKYWNLLLECAEMCRGVQSIHSIHLFRVQSVECRSVIWQRG